MVRCYVTIWKSSPIPERRVHLSYVGKGDKEMLTEVRLMVIVLFITWNYVTEGKARGG